jgi:hypothetical protein
MRRCRARALALAFGSAARLIVETDQQPIVTGPKADLSMLATPASEVLVLGVSTFSGGPSQWVVHYVRAPPKPTSSVNPRRSGRLSSPIACRYGSGAAGSPIALGETRARTIASRRARRGIIPQRYYVQAGLIRGTLAECRAPTPS